jgi:hypothetical protein
VEITVRFRTGFSRCAVTDELRRLKPFGIVAFDGIAEAMP